MANVKSYNTRIKLKRDTSANWEKANPILLQGEMILVETTSGTIRRKIGDGTKTYTQLPFDDEAIYNSLGQKAAASDLTAHVSDTANPHGVTKEQVGLGNVPNVATNDQTPTYTAATSRSSINSGEKLSVTLGKIKKWLSDLGTLAFKSTVAKSDLDTTVQASLNKADSALQSYTETDPTVPSWAKASSKPSYTADEISGLSDYISGAVQDTDTQYKLAVDSSNDRKFNLYSQAKGATAWTLQNSVTMPDETVYTKVQMKTWTTADV